VRQGNLGVSYVSQWSGIGEFSVGLQKASYRRTVNQPARAEATTRSNPWLYNGSLAVYASDDLAFYASYTRGLEDSGIAPENAANPGEALASSLTKQVDAGIRYTIMPGITLVTGVFEVSKPYFDRDMANLFTRLGKLRHRGIEFSLSGQPLEGLKVVMGAMFLQARVSGPTVDQGLLGSVPPGRAPALVRFNVNYGPPAWKGFSVNGQINHEGSHNANRINTLRIASATVVDLGVRYDFKLVESPASLRFDVKNVTDEFNWTVSGSSERFDPLPARRYSVRFVVDL
jgi:iron complex outermembrane receptor protein